MRPRTQSTHSKIHKFYVMNIREIYINRMFFNVFLGQFSVLNIEAEVIRGVNLQNVHCIFGRI